MNAFLILGHGFEDPKEYDTRQVLPANTYLVTTTECGVSATSAHDMFPMIEAMLAQPDMFKDPKTHLEHITHLVRKGLRILGPGDPYPFLKTNLTINVGSESGTYLAKSGIYQLPLTPADFSIWPEGLAIPEDMRDEARYVVPLKGKSPMYLKVDQPRTILGTIQTAYRGAVFPNQATVTAAVESDRYYPTGIVQLGHLQGAFTQTLEQIFERLGPGVYYYPICRSIKLPMKEEVESPFILLEEAIQKSSNTDKDQDLARLRELKERSRNPGTEVSLDKLALMRELRPLLEKYRGDDKITNYLKELEKYVHRVETIRARSAERQRTRRGGRKRKSKTNRKLLTRKRRI